MTPEGRITAAIKRDLDERRKRGDAIWYMKVHGSNMQKAGIPDWHVLLCGVPYYIEVKAPGKQPTPIQRLTMKRIATAGGTVAVVHSADEVRNLLDRETGYGKGRKAERTRN